jgi:hypothetical protein
MAPIEGLSESSIGLDNSANIRKKSALSHLLFEQRAAEISRILPHLWSKSEQLLFDFGRYIYVHRNFLPISYTFRPIFAAFRFHDQVYQNPF